MFHTPAFLPATALTRPQYHFRHAVSTSTRPRSIRNRPLCVAQEEKTQSPSSQIPNDNSNLTPKPTQTPEERKEKARNARMEAERLQLMAAKARLDFERAELQAERKRLELDKMKNIKLAHDASKGPITPLHENPYEKTDQDQEKTETSKDPKKKSSDGQKPLSAKSLSDLLSAEFPRVSESDIQIIKEKLCGMKTFFVTEVDRSPFDERVVFRGNMRQSADKILADLEVLAEKEGISERVRLFLLIDPKDDTDQNDKRPVLVALPASSKPNQTNTFSAVFSLVLGLVASFTTFSYGIGIFGLTPDVITAIAKGSVEEALLTLPVSSGSLVLAIAHDIGHRVMGARRGIKVGLPFFIPSLQIGNYGTITPLESYPALRKDMFDFAIAGPLVGLGGSIIALVAGLVLTSTGQVADWFPQVPSALFHASVLVGALADSILPAGVREQATIAVHPLTVIGYTGLLVNALNLMPIGRLDGGRIVQSLYGRVIAGRATAITLLAQAVSSLVGNSPLLLFWGLTCVFLQRESDFPCRNEIIEPDNGRTALGLATLCIMLLILIPFPDQIGDILGQY